MFFILLIGLFLRLTFINKPEGLWNDEYVSWAVASTPFNQGFWSEVLKQCHMPFYYLYLKPFVNYSDIILRITSVVPSFLAIIVMYFVGQEYSKKIGILAATITSTLSFLIYYSQEVRFYSLLFLFSALSLLFTLRIIKNADKFNISALVISNLLILFTHVLGIIYLTFDTAYILYKKKYFNKKLLFGLILILIPITILGLNIMNQSPSSQWWGHFSYTNILFLFSDFLSPILTNNVNAPAVFFYNIKLALWMTIPTIIGFAGILFGIKQNKGLGCIALGTIIVMTIIAFTGKIVFITKYSMEILPIIIILMVYGFSKFKRIGLIMFSLFIAFHIAAFCTPNYVTKLPRNEGHKIVGDILNKRKPDAVLFTYYAPDRFYRYWKTDIKTYYISKINRFEYKNNPSKIMDNIKSGDKISVVFLDSVSFFPEQYINKFAEKIPEMFVTFSHVKNVLIEFLNNNYKDFTIDKIGAWTVISGVKK